MHGRKPGFTLIEIMVVVGVIGIVGSIATFAVVKSVYNAHVKQAKTELEMVAASVLQLAWDTGRYPNQALRTHPGSKEVWDLAPSLVGLMGHDEAFPHWNGPYMDDLTEDPWGHPYFFDPDYRIKGVDHVVVGSFGPNGVGRNWYDEDDIYVLLDD